VAKGFTQQEGIDNDKAFKPVVRHAMMRALLAQAAVEDIEVEQIAVKAALLNGPLKEEKCNVLWLKAVQMMIHWQSYNNIIIIIL
jgi:hypothetical protein